MWKTSVAVKIKHLRDYSGARRGVSCGKPLRKNLKSAVERSHADIIASLMVFISSANSEFVNRSCPIFSQEWMTVV